MLLVRSGASPREGASKGVAVDSSAAIAHLELAQLCLTHVHGTKVP